MPSPNPPTPREHDFWILLLILLVTSPITGFVNAIIASKLWDLTLATQYGAGPTYQAWFGISMLFTWIANRPIDEIDKGDEGWITWAVVKTFSHVIYGLLLLVIVGLVRFVFGWH